jgi:hypothetical protein
MRKILTALIVLISGVLQAQTDTLSDLPDVTIITIRAPGQRIYSDAYTYISLGVMRRPDGIDTTTFDARFRSYEYCRTSPKNYHPRSGKLRNSWFKIRTVRNKVDKRVCFNLMLRPGFGDSYWSFRKGEILLTMGNLCPEMRIFRRYDWILDEPLSRREFRKIVNNQRWYDIRLEYDEEDVAYTMILKGEETSLEFRAYPFWNNNLVSEDRNRPDPKRLFKSYLKRLNREKYVFDKRIARNIKRGQSERDREIRRVSQYFSDEERAMSREEWLNYATIIVSDEMTYLRDAPYYPRLLIRFLNYSRYRANTFRIGTKENYGRCRVLVDSTEHSVQAFYFFQSNLMQFFYQREVRYDTPSTFISNMTPTTEMTGLFVLDNGMLVIATEVQYNADYNDYTFIGQMYDPALMTLGEIADLLGL